MKQQLNALAVTMGLLAVTVNAGCSKKPDTSSQPQTDSQAAAKPAVNLLHLNKAAVSELRAAAERFQQERRQKHGEAAHLWMGESLVLLASGQTAQNQGPSFVHGIGMT